MSEVVYLFGLALEALPDGTYCPTPGGRPVGTGAYGEPTKPLRVPVSLIPGLMAQMEALRKKRAEMRPSASNPFFTTPGLDVNNVRIVQRPDGRFKNQCRLRSTEPAPTEPTPTEPAPTEPTPTEPAPTEPTPTEPAPPVSAVKRNGRRALKLHKRR